VHTPEYLQIEGEKNNVEKKIIKKKKTLRENHFGTFS
jgi:hypothetical protein